MSDAALIPDLEESSPQRRPQSRSGTTGLGVGAADPDYVSARHWVALYGSMLGAFMAVLDIQITNASLNDILGSLGATLSEGSWISTSYLVAEIIVIALTGYFRRLIYATFLLASFAGIITREVDIPTGTAIYFPSSAFPYPDML